MKLTTRGRYAVTALIDLSLHAKLEQVCLSEVAERQHISLAYLEQLFRRLKSAGLVVATRGAKGGYALARDANDISLADILLASGEQLNLACGAGKTCDEHNPCLTHGIWTDLSQELLTFMQSKSLASLAKSRAVQTNARTQEAVNFGNIPIEIDRKTEQPNSTAINR